MESSFMEFYLPVIWALLIATAVALYVILDGFDLGVGILFPWTRDEEERDQMMNSVAPFWDGNETWLVLGGGGLWVAFPKAYAIIMPAFYLPVILMLLGLVFRGVAFAGGSTVAAFCQGIILGGLIEGVTVVDGQYGGGPFDWFSPFGIFCGFGLVAGYALLGSGWLMMRIDGPLAARARRWAMPLLVALLAFIAIVSLWTPLTVPHIADRWFSAPEIFYLWPVPLLTLLLGWVALRGIDRGRGLMTFAASVGLFLLCFVGLGISVFPYLVPPTLTLWETAAVPESQIFLLLGAAPLVPLILMYTAFVYWTFRGKVRPGEGYH